MSKEQSGTKNSSKIIESEIIQDAFYDRELLRKKAVQSVIKNVIAKLDKGELRVAEKTDNIWIVNEWIKMCILEFFLISKMKVLEVGPFEFHDKIPLKKGFKKLGIRSIPHALVRYGAFVSRGAILMPSYTNIGAYIGENTMIDTWATVGSCAQIGRNVHLSGGVGIGGVLEPLQASPVIIEDNAFIGSRCIVVEGTIIGEGAVLGANVVLTASSKIIDVTAKKQKVYKGFVPPQSVVIPGSLPKKFPAGTYNVPCALIIGKRKKSTDLKTSLNQALRDNNVSV